jgi:hypothetical protein
MSITLRNFPKPSLTVVHADCGLSERTAVVTRLCDRTNDILEYYYGMEVAKLLVPAQSNIDERMPLKFLRPCCEALNAIIRANKLDVPLVAKPTDSMDYHGFVPLTRSIAETINAVIEVL